MQPRLNPYQAAPDAMKALVAPENYVQQSGLDHSPIDLAQSWTEAMKLLSQIHVSDRVDDQAREQSAQAGLVNLTLCLAAINAWNRIAVSFRAVYPANWKGVA